MYLKGQGTVGCGEGTERTRESVERRSRVRGQAVLHTGEH